MNITLQIYQTAAEKQLMVAIKNYLGDISGDASRVLISLSERKSNLPKANSAYILLVGDLVYINNILIPLFNSLSFYTKKALDYKDWATIVQICFSGKHLTKEGLSLVSDLSSRMNNSRLTTHKNYKQVEISSDRINQVLSSPSIYEYKEGARYVPVTPHTCVWG